MNEKVQIRLNLAQLDNLVAAFAAACPIVREHRDAPIARQAIVTALLTLLCAIREAIPAGERIELTGPVLQAIDALMPRELTH